MPTDIDLRAESDETARDQLFKALDGTDEGVTRTVRASEDIEHLLLRFQILRERALEWEVTDTDAVEFAVRAGEPLDGDELVEFDVRDLPPQRRHTVLLATFDNLSPGQGFVLLNDHDPKPLSYELRSTRGNVFEWTYRSRAAGAWKVAIVKTETADRTDDGVLTTFDVREMPREDRHPAIHHRYGMIPVGETVAVVAGHEPEPLRREFKQRYGEDFAWEIVDHEPGRCRVHITKESDVGANTTETDGEHHGCQHHDADTHNSDAPVEQRETQAGADSGEEPSVRVTVELDVRDLPPAQRHEQIFDAYDELQDGQGFVLVNDHDPKPLYHQFDAEAGPEFYWEYRQRTPGEFRVLIAKDETAVAAGDSPPF